MRTLIAQLVLLSLSAPVAAAPHLVKDLNTGPATESQPIFAGSVPAAAGDVLYFAAGDPAHGIELWRSDGTPEGTERLTDVCSGRCSASPGEIVITGGQIFFTADDGVSGRELWRTDGTPGGERRVRDLCPGPCSGRPALLAELGDGLLLFIASGDGGPRQLWRSDGSRQGTVPVKTICTAAPGGECIWFEGLNRIGGLVYFATSSGSGLTLWRSDGTAEGTLALHDLPGGETIPEAATLPVPLGDVGDIGVFLTRDAFWRTDGTAAGTVPVKAFVDLVSSPAGSVRGFPLAVWNGALYAAVVAEGKETLFVRTDGTAAGTTVVRQFQAFSEFYLAATTANGVLFVTNDAGFNPAVLWRTQGTPETTQQIADLSSAESFITLLAPIGERTLFLSSPDLGGPAGLWETDGTAAGTRQLLSGLTTSPSGLFAAGGQAFFGSGSSLLRTDGTEAGTRELRDFKAGPGSGGPLDQTVLNGRLLFSAQTSLTAAPLFSSDGTAAGTRVVSAAASWATGFARLGNRAAFTSSRSNGLWWTDGTRSGTGLVAPGLLGFQSPSILGNQLLFGAATGGTVFGLLDLELFRSDGTAGGTRLVKNIDPFLINSHFHHDCVGESSTPGRGVAVGGRLLFAADDGRNGRELWTTDGTRAGTRLLRDINTGHGPRDFDECNERTEGGLSSSPEGLAAFRGGVLFTADDGKAGRELWWSNGTLGSTRRVKDLRPGLAGSNPHDLTVLGGVAYFFASASAAAGEALWRTDGTNAGTFLVDDLRIGGLPSWARSLTAVGGRLFFSVYNEATGAELWASRGDALSTHLVADLRPGAPGSSPQALAAVGNVLVFAADDGEHGLELWRSDGTAAGTRRLGDINPGRDASSPGPFSRAGDTVLTGADDGEHGRELWAIPVGDL